jgi:hypothetical protein
MTHQNPTTKPLSNYCGKISGCGGFLPNALYEACVMSIIVEIKGRKALVVWTLPYVTSWRLSPDTLLGGCPRIRLSNEQPLVEFGEI